MDKKIFIQDLTDGLAARKSISKKDAAAFIRTSFEIIEEYLLSEGLVKVKGLGTFKLVEVGSRESINVNTGERFTIDSHNKVSFTPDKALGDHVNRPFSDFETVVLNEGTSTEDMERVDEPEAAETPQPQTLASEPANATEYKPETVAVSEPVPVPVAVTPEAKSQIESEPVPEPVPEPTPKTAVEPQSEFETEPVLKPMPVVESEPEPVPAPELKSEPVSQAKTNNPEPPKKRRSYAWLIWLLFLLLLALLLWWWIGVSRNSIMDNPPGSMERVVEDTLEEKGDTLSVAPQPVKPQVGKSAEELAADYPQIENGEYWIVGTKAVHVLEKGEDLSKLAFETYGDKRLINYIIRYNHYSAAKASNLFVGTEVKLPELVKRN